MSCFVIYTHISYGACGAALLATTSRQMLHRTAHYSANVLSNKITLCSWYNSMQKVVNGEVFTQVPSYSPGSPLPEESPNGRTLTE